MDNENEGNWMGKFLVGLVMVFVILPFVEGLAGC